MTLDEEPNNPFLFLQNRYVSITHHCQFVTPTHNLLLPATIFSPSPGDDRRGLVSDLEAVGREGGSYSRTHTITLYFSLQSRAVRRLTHSLWDVLDNSVQETRLNTK